MTTPVDLNRGLSCESEPIRIPGKIQSHGVLLALRHSDFTILQASENVSELFGINFVDLISQPLSRIMDIRAVETASKDLPERVPRLLNPIPISLSINGKMRNFDGILHRSGGILILELELHRGEETASRGFGSFYEGVREVSTKLMEADSLAAILTQACDEVKRLTGFARVIIYKFDHNWDGSVLAEAKETDQLSLLRHHFPASDIPKQARELYLANWLRIIPNVEYQATALYPLNNPLTEQPLDLSHSVLRSVSPVHIQYMKNMGQAASMSISLITNKKLWGLIACHHTEPRYLKYDVRVAAEFIGQIVSGQIASRENTAELDHRLQLKALFASLLRKGGRLDDVRDVLADDYGRLLSLTDAAGAALIFGEDVQLLGQTPNREQVVALNAWLSGKPEQQFETSELQSFYPPARHFQQSGAGIIAMKIPRGDGGTIIWFRPELREETAWGGDPTSTKILSADGFIEPRQSFATWYEKVAGRSARWLPRHLESANELLNVILSVPIRNQFGPEKTDLRSDFRSSLASSLALTEANQMIHSHTNVQEILEVDGAHNSENFNSRFLIEGITEIAILFLDPNGVVKTWTAGAKRLLGYSSSKAIGRRMIDFHVPSNVEERKFFHSLEGVEIHGPKEEELWLVRADESQFWAKVILSSVKSELGIPLGFSVVILDVTKEKAAEEELKATKIVAESANRAKSAFLANISHEIRTPLGAVLGFAELLGADDQSIEEKALISERIRRNGIQLTALINDLLDLTKVETGRLEVEVIAIDLLELLQDTHETLNFKASEKSINFTVEVKGNVPSKIYSDPTRIRQILINLVGNAIKFTDNGGSVQLKCAMEEWPMGQRLTFRVSDSGRGMTELEMARLFQPFVQADVSITRKYGGSGLGIFVSQKLARSLGGDLTIESSKPSHGSTFLVSINPGESLVIDKFSKFSDRQLNLKTKLAVSSELHALRILIVDDSPDNRELIRIYLEKAGAQVELASNGEEGLRQAVSKSFDVVLMDIQMPVMDGNSAMQQLKSVNYGRPVIALTAHAMKAEREHSLTLGFADYLTKPINRELLIQTITRLASPVEGA